MEMKYEDDAWEERFPVHDVVDVLSQTKNVKAG